MNIFKIVSYTYNKRTLIVFSCMVFFVIFFSSCSAFDSAKEPKLPALYINGEKSPHEDAIVRTSDSVFVSLESLKGILDYEERLFKEDFITTFISVEDYDGIAEYKNLFNNPNAVIINVPIIKFQSKPYISVNFLRDFFDIRILDLDPHFALFSSDEVLLNSESGSIAPDSAGIIESGTRLKVFSGASDSDDMEEVSLRTSREVYFSRTSVSDSVIVFGKGFGMAYVDNREIGLVSDWLFSSFSKYDADGGVKYKKLQMSWDILDDYEKSIARKFDEKIKGLDIIIPTAFSPRRFQLKCSLSHEYLENARSLGYSVHGSLSNNGDSVWTSSMLNSDDLRKSFIDSILFSSMYFGLDGINLDFVNVRLEDYDEFANFCSELGSKVHDSGLLFTVNLLFQDFEQGLLDYAKLKTSVDYIVLFAMDEYSSDSKVAGPVASVKWVLNFVEGASDKISVEKLILAQPAYVRDFEVEGRNLRVLSSVSYGMSNIGTKIKDVLVDSRYDEPRGQYYYSFKDPDDGSTHVLWSENKRSLKEKLEMLKLYNLGGFAVWRLGFEDDWYWKTVDDTLNPRVPE